MAWNNISLAPTGASVHDSLSPVLSGAAGELAGSEGRLSSISGLVPVAVNPLSGSAAVAVTLRTQLTDLTSRLSHCICVHPYLHPVGHRRAEFSYLTPNDTLKTLANKLLDPEEKLPSRKLGAVFVMLYAASHADFITQLDLFLQVFPVTELQRVMRRADSLNSLEKDKFVIPAGRVWPEVVQRDPRQHNTLREVDTTLGRLVSIGEGYNEATTPEAALSALIQKKKQHVEQAEQAWQDLAAAMSGGAGHAMYCEGSPAGLRSALFKSGTPSSVYKLSCAMCWIAQPEQLTIFKEVFQL